MNPLGPWTDKQARSLLEKNNYHNDKEENYTYAQKRQKA